jgi:hypothetical protein
MIQSLHSETLSIEKLENMMTSTALEASISIIIYQNHAFKQKPENIKIIIEPISSEA